MDCVCSSISDPGLRLYILSGTSLLVCCRSVASDEQRLGLLSGTIMTAWKEKGRFDMPLCGVFMTAQLHVELHIRLCLKWDATLSK